jgi:hypothetical protein
MSTTTKKKENPLKVVTPKFRLSFPELFEPKAFENQAAKYSIQMLFDKKTDLAPLKNAVKLAAKEKWGDNTPKGLVLPFKDGNEKELEGYENMIVVGAASKFKPQVVDNKLEAILAADDIYAGCFARGAINAYAWEYKNAKGQVMKRGVSFNLESVQKLAEGPRFVSRPDAADTFDAVDDGSDNADNYASDDDDFMN